MNLFILSGHAGDSFAAFLTPLLHALKTARDSRAEFRG